MENQPEDREQKSRPRISRTSRAYTVLLTGTLGVAFGEEFFHHFSLLNTAKFIGFTAATGIAYVAERDT